MKNNTCCFTGHRDCADNSEIREKLMSAITELITIKDVRYFGAGGALGFDTIASLCVLELKKTYPHIKLILVLPCPEQDKYWSYNDKAYMRALRKWLIRSCMFPIDIQRGVCIRETDILWITAGTALLIV